MGVHSLWDILGPTARPVRLEALSRKRLAVDASIWIYQFLKAVRDGEGNALPNSHIFGFFRRICKLIFYGIRPIFVFDGGAPALKRETIRRRRERREGQAISTRQTAQQLLAMQLKRRAELEHANSKVATKRTGQAKTSNTGDGTVYLEDLPVSHVERGVPEASAIETRPKTFLKQNEYHLPEVTSFKVRADDQRIMPEDEYAAMQEVDFDIVDGIDVNTVDPKSKEFEELPIATRYMILANLRLKSRLRLGYRKDQLENLFPNSMDFSKFQIQQVQKRNFYTQLLMHVSGMGGDATLSEKRIAGDKDRKYALVKNDNGWTLALRDNNSSVDNPVLLDDYNDDILEGKVREPEPAPASLMKAEHEDTVVQLAKAEDSESDFEDVPLEEIPELELEKRYQQAIIESIYDQYRLVTPGESTGKQVSNFTISESTQSTGRVLDLPQGSLAKSSLFSGMDSDANLIDLNDKDISYVDPATDSNAKTVTDGLMASSVLFSSARNEDSEGVGHNEGLAGQVDVAPNLVHKSVRNSIADNVVFDMHDSDVRDPAASVDRLESPSQPPTVSDSESVVHIDDDSDNENVLARENPDEDIPEAPQPKLATDSREHANSTSNSKVPMDGDSCDKSLISGSPSDISYKAETPQLATTLPVWFDNNSGLTSHIHDAPALAEPKETQYEQADSGNGLISWNEANEFLDKEKDEELKEIVSDEVVEIEDEPAPAKLAKEATVPEALHTKEVQPDLRGTRKVSLFNYDFEADEEEDLVKQLATEEADHESFKARIGTHFSSPKSHYRSERSLQQQHNRATRDSDEVTQTMITDVQELLKKFGIPFITAPMEAEAQCAELFHMGLVDGIITDDSDCFLFGGSKVYKNMFNQKQYVECYMMEDIEAKLGLDQKKLIELALLLGSDYTEGIKGIGPVLAVEILAEFGNLKALKSWFDENAKSLMTSNTSEVSSVRKTLLNRIKAGKLFLGDNFPDAIVSSAYTNAEVDDDPTEFEWGEPSLDQIRTYLMSNFLWEQARVDEVMVPLIRDLNRRKAVGTQSTIGEFFPEEYIQSRKEANLGKRLKTATGKLNKRNKNV